MQHLVRLHFSLKPSWVAERADIHENARTEFSNQPAMARAYACRDLAVQYATSLSRSPSSAAVPLPSVSLQFDGLATNLFASTAAVGPGLEVKRKHSLHTNGGLARIPKSLSVLSAYKQAHSSIKLPSTDVTGKSSASARLWLLFWTSTSAEMVREQLPEPRVAQPERDCSRNRILFSSPACSAGQCSERERKSQTADGR